MSKILIEICLISARGLRVGFGSSLLKHQRYAVGWLDPEDKYCTKPYVTRSKSPIWKTKFATLLDHDDDSAVQDLTLHVEVYSIEPFFLVKKLHGSVAVSLKQFLSKYKQHASSDSVIEETGSYQLWKTNSRRPQGFVDVSIRIAAEREARWLRVGLGSSLLKHQWYAVGWLDPEEKYCTKLDISRSNNPIWRTKFATILDHDDDSAVQDLTLHVGVYSREPFFSMEKLHGSATISLKQFISKYKQQSSSDSVIEETRSYHLWNTNSRKPQGFVHVSIRIAAEREGFGGLTDDYGGVIMPSNNSDYNNSWQHYTAGSSQHPFAPLNQPNPLSLPPNPLMNNNWPQMQEPYYPPPSMQPPPPSNVGYVPSSSQNWRML